MSFKDISARIKATKSETADSQATHSNKISPEEAYLIRGKMLGVLLRDARISAGRSLEDCAVSIKISPQVIESWEFGEQVPSLPQLEILASYLGVAVSHFWGQTTIEAARGNPIDTQVEYLALRDRMIGALLRQAREEMGMSVEQLSAACEISVERIQTYELGEASLPMHELSVLSGNVKKNLNYFLETNSHIGELLAMKEEWKHFTALPEELRRFAANPLNIGFIEIAIMLAQMPTDRLRRVGESVLNITM